jgi:hypothetical protein
MRCIAINVLSHVPPVSKSEEGRFEAAATRTRLLTFLHTRRLPASARHG